MGALRKMFNNQFSMLNFQGKKPQRGEMLVATGEARGKWTRPPNPKAPAGRNMMYEPGLSRFMDYADLWAVISPERA
jgi:hypothetical protein